MPIRYLAPSHLSHSMVSHGFQGKLQPWSWTQKVPHCLGLRLQPCVFVPFSRKCPLATATAVTASCWQILDHPLLFSVLLWLEICWCFGLQCAFPLRIRLIYYLFLSFKFLPTLHWNHSESLACPPLLSVPTTLKTSIKEHIPGYSLTASLLHATELSQVSSLVCEY